MSDCSTKFARHLFDRQSFSSTHNVEYVVKLVKRCCVLPLVKHADIMNAYDYARSTLDSPNIELLIRGKDGETH